MSITMYNCGFGDCFCVEDEYVKRPLYVDFGIHRNSLVGNKIARYNVIANEMMYTKNREQKQCDFLLTHYHEDHYSGIRKMKKKLEFENVYIPDVWEDNILLLIVLEILYKRKMKKRGATNILEVLLAVANTKGRLYLVSRGSSISTGLIALWPATNILEKEAERLLVELDIYRIYEEHLSELLHITHSLKRRVDMLQKQEHMQIQTLTNKIPDILSIKEIEELIEQLKFKIQIPLNYDTKVEKFNNEISIVFQNRKKWCTRNDYKDYCYDGRNCHNCFFRNGTRNLLFTGDVPNDILKKLSTMTDELKMHKQYDIIKIPHHGTEMYFFDFSPYIISGVTKCLIPNEKIKAGYDIYKDYENTLQKACVYSSENDCVIKWINSGCPRKVIGSNIKEENL